MSAVAKSSVAGKDGGGGGGVRVAPPGENTLRVMVTSDTHLGYLEDDPVRGNDSFLAFEEVLQKAREHQVDFVLHGGDLFHHNKPSRRTVHRAMELLRRYCLGDRPVKFSVLSDQKLNFSSAFERVNYEDPNFNVELPFFTVHGNHDDPAGSGALSALDLLSVANFLNYFGKTPSVDAIAIYPILLQKGTTRVALYGLGNVRDERLYRTFQQQKVRVMRPVEHREDWFNIFVLHQNRVAHSPKNYVHEVFLEEWLDIVIWGHEHECLITPTPSAVGHFFISQPGSTVATSLSDGEAKPKMCGLLEVRGDKFRMRPQRLTNVRPLAMDTLVLSSVPRLAPDDHEQVARVLADRVAELAADATAEAERSGAPTPPLVRLKVEFSGGFSTISPARFGQQFVGRVANPADILLFFKKRSTVGAGKRKGSKLDAAHAAATRAEIGVLEALRENKGGQEVDIESTMDRVMSETTDKPQVLDESELHRALRSFVDKDDKDALGNGVIEQIKTRAEECITAFKNKAVPTVDEIRGWIADTASERAERVRKEREEDAEEEGRINGRLNVDLRDGDDDDDADADDGGAGKRKVKREPSAKREPSGRREKKPSVLVVSDEDDSGGENEQEKPARGQKKSASASAKAKQSAAADEESLALSSSDDDAAAAAAVKDEPPRKRARGSSRGSSRGLELKTEQTSPPARRGTARPKSWAAAKRK